MVDKTQATEEQLAYAKLLNLGMKVGMLILVVTFAIYVFGILEPNIAFDELPNQWEKSAADYVHDNGEIKGWSWAKELDKGDFLNFTGIAFLAAVSVICYLRVVPILFGKKDYIYVLLALIEVGVLVYAASGYAPGAGH